jgi:hypothetical protein
MQSEAHTQEQQALRSAKDNNQAGEPPSERPFLRKAETWQSNSVGRFRDLHLHGWRVGRSHLGRTQDRKLCEHFAVNLGDKVILAGRVLAPHLPEFDALHGQRFLPDSTDSNS